MRWALSLSLFLLAARAEALPRFAVRTALPCSACHVNSTGGGLRTAFARDVFVRQFLTRTPTPDLAVPSPEMQVSENVSLGTDLRAGYLFTNSAIPQVQDTASFSLMQADLYVGIDAPRYLTFYLDLGVYGAFEAFGIVRPWGPARDRDFFVKAGHFVVPFGLRDVNHQEYVREGIGFGTPDRDNGVEVGVASGRFAANAAVTNGTYGDSFLDLGGTRYPKPYDTAITSRVTYQTPLGPFQTFFALSGMFNQNAAQQNPLFLPALFTGSQLGRVGEGVDELRLGFSANAALGRLGFRSELVVVRDTFASDRLRPLLGYVSYEEISVVPITGLELLGTYEFADSDVEFERGRIERLGVTAEWFVVPSLELGLMLRHSFGASRFLIGGRDDVIVFMHVFF